MAEDEAAGSRVILRELIAADEDEFLGLARASVGLHHPWYTMPTTPGAFGTYLTRLERPSTEGRLVCVRDSGAMAGVIVIDSIIRGRFQSGSLSYGAFAGTAGRGYMSEGLGLMMRMAFGALRLHRLDANIQPANQASLALVRRHGFRREGYSPDMLFIDGAWRDHERWAITVEMTDIPVAGPHPTLPAR